MLDARHKGWPQHVGPLRRSEVGAQGWRVLGVGEGAEQAAEPGASLGREFLMPLPLAVIKRAPLAHNLAWMQSFCQNRGIQLAPHGKTSMSPQLFQRQLLAGAWGMTVATVAQLRVAVEAGAQRVIIANQVLQAVDLAAIVALRKARAALRVLFLLDSLEELQMIEAAQPALPLEVLLELGLEGARTGCRTEPEALALARAVKASSAVLLAGIEVYEGSLATGDSARDAVPAAALMARVQAIASACDAQNLFETAQPGDELIVTAGGSAIFDLVAPGLNLRTNPPLSRPVQGLLRSGCYVTHDDGNYKRLVSAVNQRIGCTDAQGLRAAIEVWCMVQSTPEPGLALLTAGRRDVSYDLEMPIPVKWCPAGETRARPVPEGWRIKALNDQHAYLMWGAVESAQAVQGSPQTTPQTPALTPKVGDRIGLGISHPCTTFDKWRWMPVVDEDYRVVDAITTNF
jgi:D-serine dehydratase